MDLVNFGNPSSFNNLPSPNISSEIFWLLYLALLIITIIISGFLIWHWHEYSINRPKSTVSQIIYITGLIIILVLIAININNI